MEWVKPAGVRAGTQGGWRDDFPLTHDLPGAITLDFSAVELPIHPMLLVRVAVFCDWHRRLGAQVQLVPPVDRAAGALLSAMFPSGPDPLDAATAVQLEIDPEHVVLPVTRLKGHLDVELVADRTRQILEYERPDVAPLGSAVFMAVSELCGNGVDHGRNEFGTYIAVQRVLAPRRQISVAVADLGMGIPEHVRQRYPEWSDDGYAIANAMEPRVTGTGDEHRGNGYTETFEAALTSTLHAARLDVHAANGFVRTELVDGRRKVDVIPAPRFRRGTWISYDIVSA